MPPAKVPPDIRDFVDRCLPGLAFLETLMLLCDGRTRSWSASAVAQAAGLDESVAADVLERLAQDNLLDVTISNDVLYRFNPATRALAELSLRCADLYARERTSLITLVTAGPTRPMPGPPRRSGRQGRENG